MNNRVIIIKGKDYSNYTTICDEQDENIVKDFLANLNSSINEKLIINYNPLGRKESDKFSILMKDEEMRLNGIIGTYRDKNYLDKYDIKLQITSRFDNPDRPFFMAEMMRCYVEERYGLRLTDSDIPPEQDDLFEFLKICIFRQKLIAAYEKGFYKKYTYFKKNDARLRGRIDISRHIQENMGMKNGRVAYEYRENTVDNPINHLILRTYDELKKAYPSETKAILDQTDVANENALSIIKSLAYSAPGYQEGSINDIVKNARLQVTHPYFTEYEELRKSCIEILSDMDISLYTENEEPTEDEVQSMLFYVPDLWEVYLTKILKQGLQDTKYEIKEQERVSPIKIRDRRTIDPVQQGVHIDGDYSDYTKDDDKHKWKPDFVLKDKDGVIAVLDAKFKPGWTLAEKQSYSEYIQVDIAKCIAYASIEGTKITGTLFPIDTASSKCNDKVTRVDHYTLGERDDMHFLACGIKIPEVNEDFADWQKRMNESVNQLILLIKSIIENQNP